MLPGPGRSRARQSLIQALACSRVSSGAALLLGPSYKFGSMMYVDPVLCSRWNAECRRLLAIACPICINGDTK